jgi:hypothetical protein
MKQLINFLKDLGFRKKENSENNLVVFLHKETEFVYDIIDETRIILFIPGSYVNINKPGKKFFYSMAYTIYGRGVLEDEDKIRFTFDKLKDYILLGIARGNFITEEYIEEYDKKRRKAFEWDWDVIYQNYMKPC